MNSENTENKEIKVDADNIETALPDHQDIARVHIDNKEFIIIGTAHISQESADLVKSTIENENPDCVCIELDENRFKAIKQPSRWESLDLKKIIKNKELTSFIANLSLSSYQKRLGDKTGVQPGTELLVAAQIAEENNIPIELCDRDIKITLNRAWRLTSFFKKMALLSSLIAGVFDKTEISEEELKNIRQKDTMNEMLKDMGEALPSVKQVLIDERDGYLAQKIRNAPGKKIVAVVGAGHQQGIVKTIEDRIEVDLAAIEEIPKVFPTGKVIGWSIPILILATLIWIGISKGPAVMGDNAIYWILANGIPSAIGALLAAAHPLTIMTAFLAAPFTSLTPVIGAGYVTAFVQAWIKPPRVFEIKNVSEDISKIKMWWKNRLLRIFLAFLLPGFGSAIGTWVGGFKIFSSLGS